MEIEKYSITEKELVAFFSKVKDENSTVLSESDFNEIMHQFGFVMDKKSFKLRKSDFTKE